MTDAGSCDEAAWSRRWASPAVRAAPTPRVAGEYRYHCQPHQSAGMVGSFTVE